MNIELFREDGHCLVLDANDPKVARLKAKGYKTRDEAAGKIDLPPPPEPEPVAPEPEVEKAIADMNVEELRAKAKALNLPITDKMGKARLIEILKND